MSISDAVYESALARIDALERELEEARATMFTVTDTNTEERISAIRAKCETAEAENERLRAALAGLPVPLDVARTHIEIIVKQGGAYTDEERARVAKIAIDAIGEVCAALAGGVGDTAA